MKVCGFIWCPVFTWVVMGEIGQYNTEQHVIMWILPLTPHAVVASTLNLLPKLSQTVQYFHPVDKIAAYIPCAISCNSRWSYLYTQIFIPSRPETTAFQF